MDYFWSPRGLGMLRNTRERVMGISHPSLSRNHQRGPVGQQYQRSQPFDAVEMELIRADIALLKAEAIANGDWAKWKEFQATCWP